MNYILGKEYKILCYNVIQLIYPKKASQKDFTCLHVLVQLVLSTLW